MEEIDFKVVDFSVYNVNKDKAPTDSELKETADAIADAFKTNGVVHLRSTGLSEDKLRNAWEAVSVFLGLQANQKETYKIMGDKIPNVELPVYKKAGYNGNYGYELDNNEAINFWPWINKIGIAQGFLTKCYIQGVERLPEAEVPGITTAMKTLAEESVTLLMNVLESLALGLGLGRHAFEYTIQTTKDHELNPNATIMRLNYFRSKRDVAADGHPEKRFGAHRDLSLLTLVRPDKKGLQMKTKTGKWIDVPIIPDTCVVQAGLVLTHMYGIHSPFHQVVFTGEESDLTERRSTVLFLFPDSDCRLKPAPDAPNQSTKNLAELGLKLDF